MSPLNYVPHVFLYPTCLMSRALVLHVPHVFSAAVAYMLLCLTCLVHYVFPYLMCIVPYEPLCLT